MTYERVYYMYLRVIPLTFKWKSACSMVVCFIKCMLLSNIYYTVGVSQDYVFWLVTINYIKINVLSPTILFRYVFNNYSNTTTGILIILRNTMYYVYLIHHLLLQTIILLSFILIIIFIFNVF